MPVKRMSQAALEALARAAEIAVACFDLFNDEDGKELAEKLIAFAKKYRDADAADRDSARNFFGGPIHKSKPWWAGERGEVT